MWNSFLERGKELAEKAKAAAETLDKQIDASVGLDSSSGTTVTEDLSAGLKGASTLLFGLKNSNNDSSQSKIDSSYLSQRESVAFVSEDDDEDAAWGDEDDIVINDEDSSTARPSQDEDENSKPEATTSPVKHDNGESLEKHNVLEIAPSPNSKSLDEAFLVDDLESCVQDQGIGKERVSRPVDYQDEGAPAATKSDDEVGDRIVQGSCAASAPDGDENPDLSTARVETKQEVREAQPDDAKFDSMSSVVDDQIDNTPEGGRTDASFVDLDVIEEVTSLDVADIRSEQRSPTPEATLVTSTAVPASDTQPISPSFHSTEAAESTRTGHPSASVPESSRSSDDLVDQWGIDAKGLAESASSTIEPSANVSVLSSNVSPVSGEPYVFKATAQMPADEDIIARRMEDGRSTREVVAPADEYAAHMVQDFAGKLSPAGETKEEILPGDKSSDQASSSPLSPCDNEAVIRMQQELESQCEVSRLLEERLDQVSRHLQQREEQLVSKTTQVSVLQADWEKERGELQAKIQATKDEAKRRIQKAKDRADAVEAKLKSASSEDAQQAAVIAALRSEGERLAVKQAEMEKAVRSAKSESRQLREQLDDETQAKEAALTQVQILEADLKESRENLASARRGESQADKLENELSLAREELERKGSTILSLEQQIKESKDEIKELVHELENSRQGAAIDSQLQQEKLMKHHEESVKDLEKKLRSLEREAAIREDALRHEVDELRKRWQDAVRRADTLSMDIQSSTAPLMRQLESSERQNRVRAAAAAEIETKLRSELEETVVQNERLTRECSEIRTKMNRLDRRAKDAEDELRTNRAALENRAEAVNQLEERIRMMEAEGARLKKEWAEIERLANEGVARVRSEMTQTVVDSEARHRSQVDSLQSELAREQEKVRKLEEQVQGMIDRAGANTNHVSQPYLMSNHEAKQQRLRKSVDQTQILAGALGLDDESDEDDDVLADGALVDVSQGDSFAAIEELSSRLKAAKVELKELRNSLADSERSRAQLVEELGESRVAKEKLPLFETKVRELTAENEEQALEIMGLREDIDEVRELYRAQLNTLLEEKAKLGKPSPPENGSIGVDDVSPDGPAGESNVHAEASADQVLTAQS
jgi:hypothetical protein